MTDVHKTKRRINIFLSDKTEEHLLIIKEKLSCFSEAEAVRTAIRIASEVVSK